MNIIIIKLTLLSGYVLPVRLDSVVAFPRISYDSTELALAGGHTYEIRETPDEIFSIMDEAARRLEGL